MTKTTDTINHLIRRVAFHFGCDQRDVRGHKRAYCLPRHLAMYVLFKNGFSQADIAAGFLKDHVTVSHAVRAVEHRLTLPRNAMVRRHLKAVSAILDEICALEFEGGQPGIAYTNELDAVLAQVKRLENRVAALERVK